MKRKRACQIIIGFLVLVVSVLIAGRLLVPRYASQTAMETVFHNQIERLREIASDTKGRWNTSVEVCGSDRQLFNHPAILHASVEPSPSYHLIVGDRTFDWQTEISLPVLTSSSTSVSRHWHSTSNVWLSAVHYHSEITDKNHRRVGITLVADISKLKR